MKCPCGSQLPYLSCCGRYHQGDYPPTALALMKSRYSAYATKQIDYIIATTHPDHSDAQIPLAQRREQIKAFSEHTLFEKLDILAVEEGDPFSTVTFRASLKQNGKDVSFTEKSLFEKVGLRWLYKEALSLI